MPALSGSMVSFDRLPGELSIPRLLKRSQSWKTGVKAMIDRTMSFKHRVEIFPHSSAINALSEKVALQSAKSSFSFITILPVSLAAHRSLFFLRSQGYGVMVSR